MTAHVLLLVGLLGCGAARPSACDPGVGKCQTAAAAAAARESLGLRVVLADTAKSVCVLDEGCPGGPKGTIRTEPLEPKMLQAVSEALIAAGLQLVSVDAERDVLADVEWRGTDTIALRLQDTHGRLIDQASFSRSLEPCRQLANLSWDSCWAANLPSMKQQLTELRHSAGLLAFAHKTSGSAGATAPPAAFGPIQPQSRGAAASTNGPKATPGLDAAQLEETVARHREEMQRRCWQPALEAREPSAPRAARVSTRVSIAPSGRVDNVITEGDPPGYLHLAACVADQLRSWHFPPAKSASAASIPFVFASD